MSPLFLFSTLFLALFSSFVHAGPARRSALMNRQYNTTVPSIHTPFGDFAVHNEHDGARKYELSKGGVLEGSLVVSKDGEAKLFNRNGIEVDLGLDIDLDPKKRDLVDSDIDVGLDDIARVDADIDAKLDKRFWPTILRAIATIAVKLGAQSAADWVYCVVVTNKAYSCVDDVSPAWKYGIA
ncbi:hypothetical protein FE257_003119 [Aspergillus nanangensis]|uniref:Uncharacterized protein n=1 Tax=Aspergillus nanangensis TaxID=2582783 RepID=A0AAD4CC85_ASPNN|nr:hypothetical protein FE257_003119 [Aspergillus nanangensis]